MKPIKYKSDNHSHFNPELLTPQALAAAQAFIKQRQLTDALSLLESVGLYGNQAIELIATLAPVSGRDA